ncbi:SDR family oxidoreductase [Pseudomonas sp. TMW22090]|uniref:SDR family oxidoreductase n=1 Tax=Pseudomonas sp. TMW22090 TaxID=2506434 RepID=UPI001F0D9CB5|nr:SDR family oxidoreductase [Pseudomonas sp. TMW22090]MCH4876463.1 SDR family oxidoreductase [Pseudomonas sp. TMW22090]
MNPTMANPKVALVVGANGIIGHALAEELKREGWRVRALDRRAVVGTETILADLTDADAVAIAVNAVRDTTHVFYAAFSPDPDLAVEASRNANMLANVLDGLEQANSALQRVVIYQGFKIYGSHLGAKVRTPALESDAGHMPPNLYLAQEAQLRKRAEHSRWDYVALRPDLVVGDIYGNTMNIALVIGVFTELSRALDIPLRFPGTDKAYGQLLQFTDAGLLARASVWAALSDSAGGEAFNVANGDIFRWERMWQDTAKHFGMETASPVPLTLARHMPDKAALWREIADRHNLIQPDLGKLVGWGFGDFIFHTETDIISDTNKIYRYGFTERVDSKASLFDALDSLKKQRVLP